MQPRKLLATLAAVAAAAASVVAGTSSPAMAERTPVDATGNSTVQFGGPALNAFERGTCGTLTAAPTGIATLITTGAGKLKAVFPVTGLVFTDTGGTRIAHAGSGIALSNSCYEVRLTNLYIQDLGGLQQTVYYDVLARAISDDEDGSRISAFRLDVTPARQIVVGRPNAVTVKIKGMDLQVGDDGAAELNQLATGDENSGPFSPGQLLGKATTSVRFGF